MRVSQLFLGAVAATTAFAAQGRVLVKPSTYKTIQRYTLFSAATYGVTLQGECPHPPFGSVVVANISIRSTDTQVVLFRDDDAKEFVLAFPGTSSQKDFDTDFNATLVPYSSAGVFCPGCKAHGGFLKAWNSVLPAIRTALDRGRKNYPKYKIVISGHSLGGALAALGYSSLTGLKYPVTSVFTFGQPRIGDQKVATYINTLSKSARNKVGSFYRVTHAYDGVPNLPPYEANFAHPFTEFFELNIFKKNGTIVPIKKDNETFSDQVTQGAKATYRCLGADSIDCNRGYADGFINAAHLYYSGVHMIQGPNGTACGGKKL